MTFCSFAIHSVSFCFSFFIKKINYIKMHTQHYYSHQHLSHRLSSQRSSSFIFLFLSIKYLLSNSFFEGQIVMIYLIILKSERSIFWVHDFCLCSAKRIISNKNIFEFFPWCYCVNVVYISIYLKCQKYGSGSSCSGSAKKGETTVAQNNTQQQQQQPVPPPKKISRMKAIGHQIR